MEHIKEAVKDYLKEKNSSYAILLTGKWGSGKTHYYNKELAPMINSTNTIEDNSKPYKAVYISLFGLKSVKDLQLEVFWTINKLVQKNQGKTLGKLLSPLASIFSKKYTGVSINIGSMAHLIVKNFINYQDIVLCFDDLERRHSSLSLQEIIAFVNNLTEHEKTKVLIIANEDQINKENYKDVKEKVIHDTLLFEPDWKTQVEHFIKYHYGKKSAYPSYGDFLLSRLEDIVESSKDADCNLRTLDFTLKKVQKIYCQLEANNYSFSNKAVEKAVYQFAIITCIQYKNEAIDFSHRTVLAQLFDPTKYISRVEKAVDKAKQSTNKNTEENFYSKTWRITQSVFLDSIFCFITGKLPIDLEHLKMEIEQLNSVIPNPMLPQNKLLDKLQFTSMANFTDEEYYQLHESILDHAKKGEYLLWEYPTVFYFLMKHGDQLYNYKAAEIVKQLKEGILIAPEMRVSNYPKSITIEDNNFKDYKYTVQYNELKNFADKCHMDIIKEKEKEKNIKFRQNFIREWESSIKYLRRGKYKDVFFDKDFIHTIYSTAVQSNPFIKNLISFFVDLPIYSSDKRVVQKEIAFLKELSEKLSQCPERNGDINIKYIALGSLLEEVEKRRIRLQNYLQNNPIFHNTSPSTPTTPPSTSGEI